MRRIEFKPAGCYNQLTQSTAVLEPFAE